MEPARRHFSSADQRRFAAVSGDCNPMHVDTIYARRTQAGAPVVHGIHLVLWALDCLAAAHPGLPPLRGLRASFNKFVYVDEHVRVELAPSSAGEFFERGQTSLRGRLVISVDGSPRCKVNLELGGADTNEPESLLSTKEVMSPPLTPLDLDIDQMSASSGRLAFVMSPQDAVSFFPAATSWLGEARIAALGASSQVVGMVCPGLHSIYSELRMRTYVMPDANEARFLDFQVSEADPRFRSLQLRISGGGLTGTVECSARSPPVSQATMTSLTGLIDPVEFAGSVALIIGGSRGLGELTAKVIAAGGGRVYVTWHSGKDDARAVSEEIRSAGGVCEILQYDALRPAAEQLKGIPGALTHAYYFATSMIFRPRAEIFSTQKLEEFLALYVEGLWRLSRTLYDRRPDVSIFYPSSVFIVERPAGMVEYAMAKAAGELLCAELSKSMKPFRATVKRLPRLLTDQTGSTDASSALEVMLPIIREMQARRV